MSICLYASQLILHYQLSHPMIYLSFYLRRYIEYTEYTPTYLSPALSLASYFDLSYFYQSIFPSCISFHPSIHPSIHRFNPSFHPSIVNNMDQWIYMDIQLMFYAIYMDVSENRGTPKWMVYNGKPY